MPKRNVLVATDNKKAIEFFVGYFADTQSAPSIVRSKHDLDVLSDLKRADFIFIQADWLDEQSLDWLKELKLRLPKVWLFSLGHSDQESVPWDEVLEFPVDEKLFRAAILKRIEYPPTIKLVVVDDEREVSDMILDYFGVRTNPAFEIRVAFNGLEGFKLIEQEPPHCLILDLKMPVRTGVQLYQDLIKSGRKIPTIIFIDSTAADDLREIRKWGAPIFMEKGGHYSTMPEMLAMVKKMVAFC